MKSPVSGGGVASNSVLNSSTASGFAATDKKVNENLEAFYRARNEIYK
jgi:hypothetical protein